MNKIKLNALYVEHKKVIITLLLIIFTFVIGEFLVVTFKGAEPGAFLSANQMLITLRLSVFIALFGLCQMLVISIGGDLDLSVGFIATLAGVFGAKIMMGDNKNLLLAIIVAIAIGAFFGLLNGLLTAYAQLPSLVVTMAMANIIQGIINAYTQGASITGKPSPIIETLAAKFTGIFPNILFVLIVVIIITTIIMTKTSIGARLRGIGENSTNAYLCGINVRLVKCLAFITSGVLAGLIGLLLVGNAGQAYKNMGSNYVMPSIVAVVVGGLSIKGGDGNYFSVVLGAVVLQILTNLFVSLGWGDAGKWTGYGIILLIMLIAYVRNKRSR